MQIDNNRHNRTSNSAFGVEVEPQGYRHFFDTIVRLTVTLGTTLLQCMTLSPNLVKGQVKYESILACTRPHTKTLISKHFVPR